MQIPNSYFRNSNGIDSHENAIPKLISSKCIVEGIEYLHDQVVFIMLKRWDTKSNYSQ